MVFSKPTLEKAAPLLRSRWLPWFIIAVGIFLRLAQYLLDRSLWIDEAFLALNILDRSWVDLLRPLDYNQGAPVGFLIAEKFITQILGDTEYALRLLPFLAGVLSLLLFYKVATWFLSPEGIVIALGLFTLSDRLIYYSSELKQYSSDVAVGLLLYLAFVEIQSRSITPVKIILIGLLGALAIWFSHPAVFILAGVGLSLIIFSSSRHEWSKVRTYVLLSLVWLLSFVAFYFLSIRALTGNEELQESWSSGHQSFMPLLPSSPGELRWFFDTFFAVFNYPVGLYLTGIAALAFIVGCVSMFAAQREKFFMLLSPIVLTLLASGLHQYPFKGQLLLFMVPLVLLVIAQGVYRIVGQTWSNIPVVGVTVAALLFFHPLYYATWNLLKPQNPPDFEYQRVRESIEPVLRYVAEHRQEGDVLHLYYASQYAFKYYLDLQEYDFNDGARKVVWLEPPESWFEPALPSYLPGLVVGKYARDDWEIFERELEQLRGQKRVWFIFSHVRDRRTSIDEQDMFLYLIDRIGTQMDVFTSTEASAYLYNLSKTPESNSPSGAQN